MHNYLKYGASAVALIAAVSLAHAQGERQEKGGAAAEHPSTERGGEKSKSSQGAQPQGKAAAEREQGGAQHNGRTAQESQGQKKPEGRAEGETKKGQQTNQSERSAQQSDHNAQQNTQNHDAERDGAKQTAGREENGGGRTHANIKVTSEQKTRIHDFIQRDSGIQRYHRSDVHFDLNVGTRIPDTIVFYDPPPQFLQIDPEFQGYKIIVLDDVILIVDPETREIVDVIQT